MTSRKPSKPLWEMSAQELRRATRQFDHQLPPELARPLNQEERAKWSRARKRGRPRVGAGAKVVAVTIERRLLAAADKQARALGISRAQLIAQGLRTILKPDPGRAA